MTAAAQKRAARIIGQLMTKPEYRFVDSALLAAIVRDAVDAIDGDGLFDAIEDAKRVVCGSAEVADAARHDAAALRQHDTRGDR